MLASGCRRVDEDSKNGTSIALENQARMWPMPAPALMWQAAMSVIVPLIVPTAFPRCGPSP